MIHLHMALMGYDKDNKMVMSGRRDCRKIYWAEDRKYDDTIMGVMDEKIKQAFANGKTFTKSEARERLIGYHSIDTNEFSLRQMSLDQICAECQWALEEAE